MGSIIHIRYMDVQVRLIIQDYLRLICLKIIIGHTVFRKQRN